jgi:hypothetical protein
VRRKAAGHKHVRDGALPRDADGAKWRRCRVRVGVPGAVRVHRCVFYIGASGGGVTVGRLAGCALGHAVLGWPPRAIQALCRALSCLAKRIVSCLAHRA